MIFQAARSLIKCGFSENEDEGQKNISCQNTLRGQNHKESRKKSQKSWSPNNESTMKLKLESTDMIFSKQQLDALNRYLGDLQSSNFFDAEEHSSTIAGNGNVSK